jgi:magnesium transporter
MTSVPSGDLRGGGENGVSERVPLSASVLACGVYVDGRRLDGEWTYAEAVAEVGRRGQGFVWLGLHEPSADRMRDVADAFGLPVRAVWDVGRAYYRPKLERRGDTMFMVLKTVHHVAHESPGTANDIVETGEIMAFLGADFIVTVRHGEHSGLRGLRAELEAAPERLDRGPSAVLHAIADHVVDSYVEVASAFEADVDEIESLVFAPRSLLGAEQMYLMKREIVELCRSVTPLAALLRGLAETESPLVRDEVRSDFRELDDHLTAVAERVAGFDDLLSSLLRETLAKVTLGQNDDVRRIAAWAAIIAVPTLVVGVYGTNFEHLPELRWEFGRPAVLGVVFLGCVVLQRMFRRNRWL